MTPQAEQNFGKAWMAHRRLVEDWQPSKPRTTPKPAEVRIQEAYDALTGPMTSQQVAEEMDISAIYARVYLERLVDRGRVRKDLTRTGPRVTAAIYERVG